MSTYFSNYLQSFDDSAADGSDTDLFGVVQPTGEREEAPHLYVAMPDTTNDDARDTAQAAEFRQHATDADGDTTIDLAAGDDYDELAALRKLLDKDDDA